MLPVAIVGTQQRGAESSRQRETIAPGWRGRGGNAHVVLPAAVAQQHIDVFQRQFGGAALLVGPAQRATTDDDLALRKEPVRRSVVVACALGESETCHHDAPVRLSADVEVGVLDVELFETPMQQRARRWRHNHAWQLQRGTALGVQERHSKQLEGGNQPLGPRRDGADAHRYPQRPCGLGFELRAKLANTRHNPAMQRPPGGGQQQPQSQHATQ